MFPYNLWLPTTLAVIVGFWEAGTLNRRVKELDVPKPTTRIQEPVFGDGPSLWHKGRLKNGSDRAHWVKGIRADSEILPVQSRNAKGLAAGKLLVASRELGDPNFARTVILIVHYDDQGVVGLVLNRRTHVPLSRALEGLKGTKDRSDPAYLGGPVDTSVVFALLHAPAKIEGAEHVFSGVYLISAKTLLEQTISTRPDPGVFHVYLGYAGWNNDQLRKEVKLGGWFIFPADVSTVFNSDPDSLWLKMIRKTELQLAENEPALAPFKIEGNRHILRKELSELLAGSKLRFQLDQEQKDYFVPNRILRPVLSAGGG